PGNRADVPDRLLDRNKKYLAGYLVGKNKIAQRNLLLAGDKRHTSRAFFPVGFERSLDKANRRKERQ
ncbi:MAG TPA: hypothetical protein VK308_16575, partial [Pyrinomonadaceae bacterium]|nr:hypothetical protein [Pyrinomonadaceae bacterium]